jgi:hypothetical protein
MKKVLIFAAIAEAATGVALLLVPSLVGRLLFGVELTGIAIPVARVLGIALVALSLACYPGETASRGFYGMLTYGLLATVYLVYLGLAGEWVGILLWPAAAIHGALTFRLAVAWLKERQFKGTKTHSD